MSDVTTIIVNCGYSDEVLLKEQPVATGRDVPYDVHLLDLTEPVEGWGGTKAPQAALWAGAFNHLDWDTFVEWIESRPWKAPKRVTVLVWFEESETVRALRLVDGTLTEVLPEVYEPVGWWGR